MPEKAVSENKLIGSRELFVWNTYKLFEENCPDIILICDIWCNRKWAELSTVNCRIDVRLINTD